MSLIEIVIAMQITALLLAILCRILPLARRQMREADLKLGGAVSAQNVLEEYLVVPLEQWPRESIAVDGFQASLSWEPWEVDSDMRLLRVVLRVGNEESYRLETLVPAS